MVPAIPAVNWKEEVAVGFSAKFELNTLPEEKRLNRTALFMLDAYSHSAC
jgi:hypothetical protein